MRDRAWVLPRYLSHIDAIDYPKNKISLFWVTHDCTDNSYELLKNFSEGKGYKSSTVLDINLNSTPKYYGNDGVRLASDRDNLLKTLSYLRNFMFQSEYMSGDYFFSVDSDVLVPKDAIIKLLSIANETAVVSGVIKNSKLPGIFNYMYYDKASDRFTRELYEDRYMPDAPFKVDLSGAVTLYSKRVCEIGRFSPCASGEDEGLVRSLVGHKVEFIVHPGVKCVHVMGPDAEMGW